AAKRSLRTSLACQADQPTKPTTSTATIASPHQVRLRTSTHPSSTQCHHQEMGLPPGPETRRQTSCTRSDQRRNFTEVVQFLYFLAVLPLRMTVNFLPFLGRLSFTFFLF